MSVRVVHDEQGLKAFHGGVFVPTMGALHEGHRALIERAREIAGTQGRARSTPVVVSVFVNPTQFNDAADFEKYPRTIEADLAMCEACGADCVFAPAKEVVYPADGSVKAGNLPRVAKEPGLEDRFRPGHFAGVVQVCRRLFGLVKPGAAVFGEKDWQQLQVIRALVRDEGLRIEIVGHPTVRERDGLALSSRNVRLSKDARKRAVWLSRALEIAGMESEPGSAEREGIELLSAHGIEPEYFVVRDAESLGEVRKKDDAIETGKPSLSSRKAGMTSPPEGESGPSNHRDDPSNSTNDAWRPARVLVAAVVGSVRLIDNAEWPGFRVGKE